MSLEALEQACLSKNGVSKEFPFGDVAMVFKVMNKMFALVAWKETPLQISLKCLPEDAVGYRDIYECVREGYHLNKKHWITVTLDGSMSDDVLSGLIDESYNLVVSKLSKKEKVELLQS